MKDFTFSVEPLTWSYGNWKHCCPPQYHLLYLNSSGPASCSLPVRPKHFYHLQWPWHLWEWSTQHPSLSFLTFLSPVPHLLQHSHEDSESYHHSHLFHLWNQIHMVIQLSPYFQAIMLQFSYPLALSCHLHFPLPQLHPQILPSLHPVLFLVHGKQD